MLTIVLAGTCIPAALYELIGCVLIRKDVLVVPHFFRLELIALLEW
jgi:hypothetical protein